MTSSKNPETLANSYTLFQVEALLRVLYKVIDEARAVGDERWKETAAPQAELLNEVRGILLKRKRILQGETEPAPQVIQCSYGSSKSKGVKHGAG